MPPIFGDQAKDQGQTKPQPGDTPHTTAKPKSDFGIGQKKDTGPDMSAVNAVNQNLGKRDASAEVAEAEAFTEDDIRMAEEILFQGWTVKSVPVLCGKHTAEIMTSIPLDIDLVDEIVNDMLVQADKDGELKTMPQSTVNSRQKLLTMATYFQGFDQKDISQGMEGSLKVIKAGINELKRAIVAGDLVAVSAHKEAIKKAIGKRADIINCTQNTMVLDTVSSAKLELETLITDLMESKGLIPKL